MALTLAAYPHWHTLPELEWEIGRVEQGKGVKRAVRELIDIGLLETRGPSIRPTEPAAHLERLELP